MGFMKLLKNNDGSDDQSKTINQDGKNYQFTPGKEGSLIAKAPPKSMPNFDLPAPVKAKVIPMKNPINIASVRG